MKRLQLIAVVALVLASLLVSTFAVSAQSGTWVSGITVQNQSETESADITITFYWAEGEALAGQVAYTHYATIAAGKSGTYYVPNLAGLPENFVGSAVVSSNQPIAANVNTQLPTSGNYTTPDNPNRVGTSSGVLTGTPKLYFTQLMKAYSGWNSYMAVQNTSSDTQANTVTVAYYDAAGTQVATQTVSIKPNTTYIFRQADNASLPSNFMGSAVVTGDQPLAGVANFYAAGDSYSTAQFHSYNGFGAGATKLYAPRVVKDFYGYQGGIRVQNVGTAATNVTITYYFGANNYSQTFNNVGPGAAASVYMGNPPAVLAGVTGTGSAVITSSGQPIVATVNEDNRTEGRGTTYNAAVEGSQTTAVLFPQMLSRYYGYSGGPQVQNVGSSAATVTATFSAQGFADTTVTATIQPNGSKSWFTPDVVSGKNFNGSVVVSSDQPIVGIANFSVRADRDPGDGWAVNYGDSYVTYNGINK